MQNDNLDHDTVTLSLDDGTEMECDVIAIFPCEDNDYIALLPQDAGEEGEVFLYRFIEKGEDDIELVNIEDDEEFDKVAEAFDEFLDSEEFDEMFSEDEE